MTGLPSYICPYCQETQKMTFESSSNGMLQMCDCKGSRDAWEMEHRAAMERRKVAARQPKHRSKRVRSR